MKTKKYKKLGLEVTETMHYGKKLKDIEIPKGWRLLKPLEAMMIWEIKEFTEIDWFYVKHVKKEYEKYVARFVAGDGGAILYCGRNPVSYSSLGVKFCRELK